MSATKLSADLREFLSTHGAGIDCAYLFGSHGRATAKPDSDVDVAILYTEQPPSTLAGLGLDLASELEVALSRKVDLLVLNRAPPDLVHRVLRDGVLVFESDRSARVRFETQARREYFDVLPYLQQYRRARARQQS